ncbi:hypothetical protein [Kitasatospora sp. NPDC059327]|uniref:hypothetical protein n=1 Tax=Kitasatospora sp. NPDC059327 TaxID=3346803 RepID=UPI00368678FD
MSREYHFHREHAHCSVTVGVRLAGTREVELLVDGKEVVVEPVHGHHAERRSLATTLPTDPPRTITVEVELPGAIRGLPSATLVDGDARLPMPPRDVPHRARPTEASWYG